MVDENYNDVDGLLPCPFCGGKAKIKTGDEVAVAQCLNMSAHRLIVDGDNNAEDEVRLMWNMRPPHPYPEFK